MLHRGVALLGVVLVIAGCSPRGLSRVGVDDVAFITAVVGDVGPNVGIDPARVYATGISNGGIMSYTLACNTGLFAAIGPDSATQLDPCRSPHPTSVMHIHGTADRLIRYDGGRGAGFAHIDGPPVTELNAFWRNVNGCGAPVATTSGPVTTSTADCADNRSVVLVTPKCNTGQVPDTHVVTNQVPPLEEHNPTSSPVLVEALIREGGQWGLDEVTAVGAISGSNQAQRWGQLADRNRPILRTHDRYGDRIDEVEYDPAYHELMRTAIAHGLHAAPWADPRPGAHVVRAAKTGVWTAEPGHMCPISMTYAVVPALRHNPELAKVYEPLLTSREYDPQPDVPTLKAGITAGMSMTEKQGGSDVRAGTTQATRNGDGSYQLTGHKWFTSAPMSDIFLVLAQAPGGLSCFLLPRVLPDGTRNRMLLQRLKDKLGNHANASSEVEYDGATAWLVGEEGRGVPNIIEMVNLTRLDCALGSATSMRTGVTRAIHHAQHRKAFGAFLIDQPLMRNVLADLAVEAEAATVVAMRMAGATDSAVRGDQTETLLRRIGLAASKYWVCKRAAGHAAEAMECLGGNGYVEDSGMPRLYREAPLMGIWEGSGNVSALDTLRAMATRAECVDVLFAELAKTTGQDPRLDAHVEALKPQLADQDTIVYRARKVAEDICLALQGSLLVRHGHPAVAEAFLATRLGGQWGGAYGTMPTGLDLAPILERALVKG